MAIFIKGQGYVYKTFPDSAWCAQQIASVSQPIITDGSIAATKLIKSDIVLPESQITNLSTDLAAKQGMSTAATSATTGTITVPMTSATQNIFTITPTAACTFNATGGVTGARMTFVVTTSGITSFTLTWGTNFKPVSTLATGTTTGKIFTVDFICTNGTQWVETCRTAAH